MIYASQSATEHRTAGRQTSTAGERSAGMQPTVDVLCSLPCSSALPLCRDRRGNAENRYLAACCPTSAHEHASQRVRQTNRLGDRCRLPHGFCSRARYSRERTASHDMTSAARCLPYHARMSRRGTARLALPRSMILFCPISSTFPTATARIYYPFSQSCRAFSRTAHIAHRYSPRPCPSASTRARLYPLSPRSHRLQD